MNALTPVLPPSPDETSELKPHLPASPLTDRQRAILHFIENYVELHGYAPSLREIARHFQIRSTNGVNDHLRALERKGYLTRPSEVKSRAITVVRTDGEAAERVAARSAATLTMLDTLQVENESLVRLMVRVSVAADSERNLGRELRVALVDLDNVLRAKGLR